MKKLNEKVLQDIFDTIVLYFEWLKKECNRNLLLTDFNRYVIGARFALNIAFDLDSDSFIFMEDFFEQKVDEYFGGKESE